MATYIDERSDRVDAAETGKVIVETPVEARQGFLGRPVLMVLIGGLLLAMVAWGISEMYGESVDDDAGTEINQTTTTTPNAVVTPTDQK